MKQVLVFDVNLMFREFLKEKLSSENVEVTFVESKRDGFFRMLDKLPDLVIFDQNDDEKNLMEFLQKKQSNPNLVKTPIILFGAEQPHEKLLELVKYNVIKYFAKPIKYDVFFDSISDVLKISVALDTTPCVLDVHLNNNIIFVEIGQGLNREKLGLLKYRISEILDQNEIPRPKVVVMLTGFKFCFVDGSNLELLFDNILADTRITKENVKVLSTDEFTKELIEGHGEYFGIEVVSQIQDVLGNLIDTTGETTIEDAITNKILNADKNYNTGSIQMQFASEDQHEEGSKEKIGAMPTPPPKPVTATVRLKIAIVDDEQKVGQVLRAVFAKLNAQCDVYLTGVDFLGSLPTKKYDAVSLDLQMPGLSGFDVLYQMRAKGNQTPVVIYTKLMQKEMALKALQLGASACVFKNQPPTEVVKQIIAALKKK